MPVPNGLTADPVAKSQVYELEQRLAEREGLIRELEAQLSEAHDDLARDEVIFADKLKEIKALRQVGRPASSAADPCSAALPPSDEVEAGVEVW